jgi:tryptophan synthase alpha subunit
VSPAGQERRARRPRLTTPTTAHDRQKAQAADRFGVWIFQLAETMTHLGNSVLGQLTQTERAQLRRVRGLMLAAADGVSRAVLLTALLELASAVLVQVEGLRRLEARRERPPVPRRRRR